MDHRRNWGDERVFFYNDQGELTTLPASWTSVFPQDPFVTISKGKSHFHIKDLIDLTKLIRKIKRTTSD